MTSLAFVEFYEKPSVSRRVSKVQLSQPDEHRRLLVEFYVRPKIPRSAAAGGMDGCQKRRYIRSGLHAGFKHGRDDGRPREFRRRLPVPECMVGSEKR